MSKRGRVHKLNQINKLFAQQNGLCVYCHGVMTFNKTNNGDNLPNTFTVDHLIPRSRGGSGKFSNLVGACFQCNQEKGNKKPKFSKNSLYKNIGNLVISTNTDSFKNRWLKFNSVKMFYVYPNTNTVLTKNWSREQILNFDVPKERYVYRSQTN